MPALSALLSSSRVTPITVDLAAFELLARDTRGGTCGWLCLEPSPGNLAEDTCLPPGLGAFWHPSGRDRRTGQIGRESGESTTDLSGTTAEGQASATTPSSAGATSSGCFGTTRTV